MHYASILAHAMQRRNTEIIKIMISSKEKVDTHTCLKVKATLTGEPGELSLAGDVTALKMLPGICTHLLSTKFNGKDWRIICRQNWTLAYAFYAIGKCKVVLFIRRLMRTGCSTI